MNKNLKSTLKSSFMQYTNKKFNIINRIKLKIREPGYKYIEAYRKGQFCKDKKSILYFLYKIKIRSYKFKYGIWIPIETKIGDGFQIIHSGGIYINQNTIIGKNFKIRQNCTIGNN